MDQAISLFSSNPLVLAVANLTALFTAIWAIYKVSGFAIRFLRSVYRTSVKTAVYRVRRNTFVSSLVYAQDIHLYVSFIFIRAATIAAIALNLLLLNGKDFKSHQEFIDNPPKFHFANYEDYRQFGKILVNITLLIKLPMVAILVFYSYRVLRIVDNVSRIRVRWHNRGIPPLFGTVSHQSAPLEDQ